MKKLNPEYAPSQFYFIKANIVSIHYLVVNISTKAFPSKIK